MHKLGSSIATKITNLVNLMHIVYKAENRVPRVRWRNGSKSRWSGLNIDKKNRYKIEKHEGAMKSSYLFLLLLLKKPLDWVL
jgi:hypothetical protein